LKSYIINKRSLIIKVALVHDWLTGFRGGEKTLEVICELFPKAPLYTLVYIKGSASATIENREIHTSFIQNLPMAATRYRHYLPLFPLAAETINLSSYDLVVSSSHAVAKSVRTGKTPHWCYIHSPMRYVWDRFDDYFGRELVGAIPSQLFFKPVAAMLRKYDRSTSSRVDHFVANSRFVAERVHKFYGRDAEVIQAPVDVNRFVHMIRQPEDYYLFFSALVPYKKADHAIKACQQLNRKLLVLGRGPELKILKSIADSRYISFEEAPDDARVDFHLSRAKALLYPGIEDMGIVPVEANAAGLPVIALRQGGVLDTLTEQTALLYEPQTVEGLKQAISDFEKRADSFDVKLMRFQAEKFSRPRFKARIETSISNFVRTL
jgi:glycosyltransferase involved in cell wall biosynthesis